MCTVTFLPTGTSTYLLTSNRDESPKRAAAPPAHEFVGEHELYFPKDPLSGGTWIATDKKRFTLCLLNGAFEKHKHRPPYRLSRGTMVLEFFKSYDPFRFRDYYDFEGIEPFTLIIVDTQNTTRIFELRWDEKELSFKELDADAPHIWSSSTLYPQEISQQRKRWFEDWLKSHSTFSQPEIINFHKKGGSGDLWNDFVMQRGDNLQTVSITSIEKTEHFEMLYEDLL